MKKFFIILSGFYLLLVGLLFSILIIFSLTRIPFSESPSGLYGVLNFVLFGVWAIATGIGIILRKNWARYSLFVMSFFAIFIGLIMLVPLFFIVSINDRPDFGVVSFLAFIFFIAVPIFFLIFFNRKMVKEFFIPKQLEHKEIQRPFGITFIAILSIIGALSTLMYAFMPILQKIPLIGDIWLSGIALRIYFGIWTIINIYIGIGLLRMRKAAWVVCILYNVFITLMTIVNIFNISETTFQEIAIQLKTSPNTMSMVFYKIMMGATLLVQVIIIAYLFFKKRLFLKVKNSEV